MNNKIKITKELIEDLRGFFNHSKSADGFLKEYLEEKGYEVEKEKSALEQARDSKIRKYNEVLPGEQVSLCVLEDVCTKIGLYEQAIEDQKIKINPEFIIMLEILRDNMPKSVLEIPVIEGTIFLKYDLIDKFLKQVEEYNKYD